MHLLMTAPCLIGLEGLVADELKFMEAENVSAENGRVFFEGDEAMLARANINSRFAERILIVLDRFKAETFEQLFQSVKSLPWSEFIGSSDTFPVKGYSINSTLHSVPDCQKIIKKANSQLLNAIIDSNDNSGSIVMLDISNLVQSVQIFHDLSSFQEKGKIIKNEIPDKAKNIIEIISKELSKKTRSINAALVIWDEFFAVENSAKGILYLID